MSPVWTRVLALVCVLALAYVAIDATGLLDDVDPGSIRTTVQAWGAWGVLLYLGLFTLGQVLHVPGIIFVVAAGLAYGPWYGWLIGMVGSLVAISACFVVARKVGGSPLAQVKKPGIVRLIKRLHHYPLRTIIVLRMMFGSAPWLSYLLALTAVRYRQYLFGAAIGLAVPVFITTWFSDWLLQYLR